MAPLNVREDTFFSKRRHRFVFKGVEAVCWFLYRQKIARFSSQHEAMSSHAIANCENRYHRQSVKKAWEVRKPGSVRFRAAIIYLAPKLPVVSSDQPERARLRAAAYVPAGQNLPAS